MGIARTMQTLDQLHAELDSVKVSVHDAFELDLDASFEHQQSPHGLSLAHSVYLRCAYSAAMLSVHTTWAYPWARALAGLPPDGRQVSRLPCAL